LTVAPNRLSQNFAARRLNQTWVADITYVPTGEGWLYLAAVLDLFTRKIVGSSAVSSASLPARSLAIYAALDDR
jgi:putative transposase